MPGKKQNKAKKKQREKFKLSHPEGRKEFARRKKMARLKKNTT